MNVPEYSQSRRLDAGRIDPDKMIAATNAALSAKFGEGRYITAWWNPTLYVDYKLIEDQKLNKVEVENAVLAFLRAYPGVEAVFTRRADGTGHDAQHQACKTGDSCLAPTDQRRHRGDEQAQLVSVREAKHLRLDSWITVVIRHQCTPRDVRAELDQTWQIRRLRSRRPRANHRFHPKRAATERLRGTGSLRGHELKESRQFYLEVC
jgi:hypothetical protein